MSLPQRVVPVAIRRIEVTARVPGAARVDARGAMLFEPGVELSRYCLVRRSPLGVATAEYGVGQVFKRRSTRPR